MRMRNKKIRNNRRKLKKQVNVDNKKFILIFIAILFFLMGCATKIVPVKTDKIEISDNFALIKEKDYDLAIRHKEWNQNPKNLNTYFVTFYVILRNKSDKRIELDMNSFNLLDSEQEQYSLYTSDEVIDVVYPYRDYFDEKYPLIPRSPNELLDIEDQFQTRDTGIKNIRFDSFTFNHLLPNATKRGYIFFEDFEIVEKTNIKIIYKDHTITFWVE